MSESAEDKLPPLSPTTRWSLIVAATDQGENPEEAREALEELCQIYRWPVLQFIVRKGYSLPDAEDLTQDFFLRLSATEFLKQASPQKGRFRSLIFASLKHLLLDSADRLTALKRGGGQKIEPWVDGLEDELSPRGTAGFSFAQDEQLFDHDWAELVVRKALTRLRDEFSMRGKEREFAVIRTFLTGGDRGNAYAEAAATLSLPIGTLKATVHRSRARYGSLLRDEVTQTVADLRDLDDEIRHLCQILATHPEMPGLSTG